MNNYHIKATSKESRPGAWNVHLCEVYQDETKIGEYIYTYSSNPEGKLFQPVSFNGKDYAIISSNYTSIGLMSLPDCTIIELKDGNVKGMCPAEIYVPLLEDIRYENMSWANIVTNVNRVLDPKETREGFRYSTLGFVSGCECPHDRAYEDDQDEDDHDGYEPDDYQIDDMISYFEKCLFELKEYKKTREAEDKEDGELATERLSQNNKRHSWKSVQSEVANGFMKPKEENSEETGDGQTEDGYAHLNDVIFKKDTIDHVTNTYITCNNNIRFAVDLINNSRLVSPLYPDHLRAAVAREEFIKNNAPHLLERKAV